MKSVICIAGPTASGKSAYALDIARAVDGEIINADALQVYADLQILSARPTKAEMQGVPHHLFGHIDGAMRYSVGDWLREAVPIIADIQDRNRVPILVGGTGLYFRALLEGLADIPAINSEIISQVQAELCAQGVETLRAEAERLDPVATAAVMGHDPQRLQRIVGVARSSGRTLTQWRADTHPALDPAQALYAAILPNRDALYARINSRYDAMVEDGGLEEAKAVFAKGYGADLPVMKAIGLRQLSSYINGMASLDTVIDDAKRESRRFAKRQYTWFRNQSPKPIKLLTSEDMDAFKHTIERKS